jgi:uncharacterized protein YfaS (alpha-2-macroglobulin family)
LVLALAQRHGAEVPSEQFDKLTSYLSLQLRSSMTDQPQLSDCVLALYALALAGRPEPAYHEKLYALREQLSPEDRALLALAVLESNGPEEMSRQLLALDSKSHSYDEGHFGCAAREEAIRLLAWTKYRPDDPRVDSLVDQLMREQKESHWETTQGNAWALLALTDYARRVEGEVHPSQGCLQWGNESIPFELNGATNVCVCTLPLTNAATTSLAVTNTGGHRFYVSLALEARAPSAQQPRQDHGFSLRRSYQRLDDENRPQDLRGLRVGDRVLVTLSLKVHDTAHYVAVDDALPSILEAINPEFKAHQTRPAPQANGARDDDGIYWLADFREIRQDRFLSFADWVEPGDYVLRYVARVRAAGTVTAPSAKVEQMYHPERYGLTETQTLTSEPLE